HPICNISLPNPAHEPARVGARERSSQADSGRGLRAGSLKDSLELFRLDGREFEPMLDGQFGQKPTLAFLVLHFVLSEAFLNIRQAMLERSVIKKRNFPRHRLGCDQPPFGLFETAEEPAQSLVDRPGQAACTQAKETACPIALSLHCPLAFATLSRAGAQPQPTGEVLLGFPRCHIRAGLCNELHEQPVGDTGYRSDIPSTADSFQQLMQVIDLRCILAQAFGAKSVLALRRRRWWRLVGQ